MSAHDTDLIELTLDTLNALDKLLHLLRSRNILLDLALAERSWEADRILWWKEFHSLTSSVENFVNRRARWSVSVYSRGLHSDDRDRGGSEDSSSLSPARSFLDLPPPSSPHPISTPSSPNPSPIPLQAQASPTPSHHSNKGMVVSATSRFMLVDKVELEASRLMARITDLDLRFTRPAAEKLDELMSLGKVPDELLDEQDKMEDRIISMNLKSRFIQDLTCQWKGADKLYLTCKALHSDSKKLFSEVERAKSRIPTREEADSFLANSHLLIQRLGDLVGKKEVNRFLESNLALDSLRFSKEHSLINPIHSEWKDQDVFNSNVNSSLLDQLASSAKRTRKAVLLVGTYTKGLEAFGRVKTLQSQLDRARESNEAATLLSHQGWGKEGEINSKAEKLWDLKQPTSDKDGSRPFLGSLESLEENSHSRYLSNIPILQSKVSDLSLKMQPQVSHLSIAVLNCVKYGIVEPTFRISAETSAEEYQESKNQALNATSSGNARKEVLVEFRRINNGLSSLKNESQDLLESIEEACLQQRFIPSLNNASTSAPSEPSKLSPRKAEQQLTKLCASLSQSRSHQVKVEESKNLDESLSDALSEARPLSDHLHTQQNSAREQLDKLQSLLSWYRALCEQAAQASALQDKYLRIEKLGNDLVTSINSTRSSSHTEALGIIKELSTPASNSRKDELHLKQPSFDFEQDSSEFYSQVEQFYHEASRLSFTGNPPTFNSFLVSSDEELRSSANAWSSKLSALKEEIQRLGAEAEMERARQKAAKEIAEDLAKIRGDNVQLDEEIVKACGQNGFQSDLSQSSLPLFSASHSQERFRSISSRLDLCKKAIEELPLGPDPSSNLDPIKEHLVDQQVSALQELKDLEALISWQSDLEKQTQVADSLRIKHKSHLDQAEVLKQDFKQDQLVANGSGEDSILSILQGGKPSPDQSENHLASQFEKRRSGYIEQINAFSNEAREYPSTGSAPSSTSTTFISSRPSSADEKLGKQVELWCDSLSTEADNLKKLTFTAVQDEAAVAEFREYAFDLIETKGQISDLSSKVKSACQSKDQEVANGMPTPSEATARLMDLSSKMMVHDSTFESLSYRFLSPSSILGHLKAHSEQMKSEYQALQALVAWFSKLEQQRQEVESLNSRFQDLSNQVSLLEEKVSVAAASLSNIEEITISNHSDLENEAFELKDTIKSFSQDAIECFVTGHAPNDSELSSADDVVKSTMQKRVSSLEACGEKLLESIQKLKQREEERRSRMELEREENEKNEREKKAKIEREEMEKQELQLSKEREAANKSKEQKTDIDRTISNAAQSISPDQSFDESLDLTKTGRTLFPLSSSRKSLSSQGIPSSASIIIHDNPSSPPPPRQGSDDVFGPVASRNQSEPPEPGIPASTSMTSLRIRITKLLARISNDEVEIQTVEDGRSQERKGIPLPDASSDAIVQEDWQNISSQCSALLDQDGFELPQPDGQRLARALEARGPRVKRYGLLASFETKASAGDEAISKFIDSLDEASGNATSSRSSPLPFDPSLLSASSSGSDLSQRAPSPNQRVPSRNSTRSSSLKVTTLSEAARVSLRSELSSLSTIIEEARVTSLPVSGDVRVRTKVKMLDKLFTDTSEMAEELLNPGTTYQRQASEELEDDFDDAGSVISSSTSLSESVDDARSEGRQTPFEAHQTEEVKSERSSSAQGRSYDQPLTSLPRSRTQSLISPVVPRTSQRSVSAMLPPRHAASSSLSMTSRLPTPSTKKKHNALPARATPTMSTPRMQVSSSSTRLPSSSSSRLPIRTPSSSKRVISGSSRKASATKARTRYRANTKSALDVAVGKIVNNLPVSLQHD